MAIYFEFLQPRHGRATFSCGKSLLDSYFSLYVTQDVRRLLAKCVVMIDADTDAVIGYYTLSSAEIDLGDLPDEIAKKLPRYSAVPAVRIGRLAVTKKFQGKKLGEALLVDALKKVKLSPIAAYAVLVDAIDDEAIKFYKKYGFIQFDSKPETLYLPMGTIEALYSR